VGDITLRLLTPLADDSPYRATLERGPRLTTFALRVADLDATVEALAAVGVPTVRRENGLAATDPATTFGIPIEWTA
jgi:hypothetical protein